MQKLITFWMWFRGKAAGTDTADESTQQLNTHWLIQRILYVLYNVESVWTVKNRKCTKFERNKPFSFFVLRKRSQTVNVCVVLICFIEFMCAENQQKHVRQVQRRRDERLHAIRGREGSRSHRHQTWTRRDLSTCSKCSCHICLLTAHSRKCLFSERNRGKHPRLFCHLKGWKKK